GVDAAVVATRHARLPCEAHGMVRLAAPQHPHAAPGARGDRAERADGQRRLRGPPRARRRRRLVELEAGAARAALSVDERGAGYSLPPALPQTVRPARARDARRRRRARRPPGGVAALG